MSEKLTLYKVAKDFQDMVELRVVLAELGEDTGPIDQQIATYFSQDVTRDKIDHAIGYYRYCEMMQAEAKKERERLKQVEESFRAQADWMLDLCKGAMEITDKKKLEGKTRGYLLLKTNGGKQALEITNPELVPDEFCEYTLKRLSGLVFHRIVKQCSLTVAACDMDRVPNDYRIRAALAKKCYNCDGTGIMEGNAEVICAECEGDGKARVPGARLAPRGAHVEVR